MEARRAGLGSLIFSDYLATCRGRQESGMRRKLMFLPRLLYHPPLQAAVMIRLAQGGPRWLFGIWRTLLIAKHSIDIEGPVEIGPGFMVPHPVSIVMARGVRIGANVQVMNHVTIGARPYERARNGRLTPDIGDGVIILAQSIVIGPIEIGENAVLGARTWIDKDVPAGTVVRAEQEQVMGERSFERPLPDLT